MTEIVERAVERLRGLQPEERDEVARAVLRLLGDEQPVYRLTPDEEADLDRADDAIARGDFASDSEVSMIWAKYGM